MGKDGFAEGRGFEDGMLIHTSRGLHVSHTATGVVDHLTVPNDGRRCSRDGGLGQEERKLRLD
jgi:hypothetical protein